MCHFYFVLHRHMLVHRFYWLKIAFAYVTFESCRTTVIYVIRKIKWSCKGFVTSGTLEVWKCKGLSEFWSIPIMQYSFVHFCFRSADWLDNNPELAAEVAVQFSEILPIWHDGSPAVRKDSSWLSVNKKEMFELIAICIVYKWTWGLSTKMKFFTFICHFRWLRRRTSWVWQRRLNYFG